VQKTFKEKENQYEEACRELIGLQNFKVNLDHLMRRI
jgi:hypothetical protein